MPLVPCHCQLDINDGPGREGAAQGTAKRALGDGMRWLSGSDPNLLTSRYTFDTRPSPHPLQDSRHGVVGRSDGQNPRPRPMATGTPVIVRGRLVFCRLDEHAVDLAGWRSRMTVQCYRSPSVHLAWASGSWRDAAGMATLPIVRPYTRPSSSHYVDRRGAQI